MNKRLKLTWKYFFQQKFLEFLGLLFILFGPYYLGKFLDTHGWIDVASQSTGHADYVFLCFLFGMILFVLLIMVLFFLYILIDSNWKRARDRAIEKIHYEEEK